MNAPDVLRAAAERKEANAARWTMRAVAFDGDKRAMYRRRAAEDRAVAALLLEIAARYERGPMGMADIPSKALAVARVVVGDPT